MRYISRFKNSIRASSVYSLAFMLTFALAAGLTTYEEAAAQPSVTLTVSPMEIDEANASASVTVTAQASAGFAEPAPVIELTLGGSATRDKDDTFAVGDDYRITNPEFVQADGTINLTLDQTSDIGGTQGVARSSGTVTLNITLNTDGAFENPETIVVSGTLSGSVVTSATIDLIDDDYDITLATSIGGNPVTGAGSDPVVDEDVSSPTSVEVTATLPSTRTSPVTVALNFSSTASSSYYTAGGTHSITIGAGSTTGSATITIDPNDNETYGGNKSIIVGGTSGSLHIKPAIAFMIDDDEEAPSVNLSVDPNSIAENAGRTNVTAKAELDGALLESAATVKLAVVANDGEDQNGGTTADTDDYTLGGTKSITISPGSKSSTTTLVFTPENDGTFEGDTNEVVILMGSSDGLMVGTTMITIVEDDFDMVLELDNDKVSEGAGEAVELELTARLTGGRRTSDLTVPVAIDTETAVPAGYLIVINEAAGDDDNITIKAGDMTGTAKITVTPPQTNDDIYSGDMSVNIVANATGLNDKPVKLNLVEDEAKPTIKLSANPATLLEGDGQDAVDTSVITGTLSGLHAETVTVTLSFGGTATKGDGKDYIEPQGQTFTISGGLTGSASVDFMLVNDGAFEEAETIIVSGTSAPGLDVTPATLTVNDDDFDIALAVGTVDTNDNFTAGDVTVSEGAEDPSTVTVQATLQSARTTPLTVTLSFSGSGASSQYAVIGGTKTITISPGASGHTGRTNITIDPNNNDLVGGDKEINVSGMSAGVNVMAASNKINIMDDEAAPTVAIKAEPGKLNENAGAASVVITAELKGDAALASAATIELTIDPANVGDTGLDAQNDPITMANENDFTVSGTKSITIPAGSKSGSTTLTVNVVDDPLFEQEETIAISAKTDAPIADVDTDDANGKIAPTSLAIVDNDFDIKLSIDTATIAEDASGEMGGDGDPVKVKVKATLNGSRTSNVPVTVTYSQVSGQDVVTGGAMLTIDAGKMSAEAEVMIDLATDEINNGSYEGDGRKIEITGTSTGYNIQGTSITITDDEVKPTVTLDVDPSSVNEDGTNDNVTVTATLKPNGLTAQAMITLELSGTAVRDDGDAATEDKHDYAPAIINVTIQPNQTTGTGMVDVNPVNDMEFEATKTIIVSGKSDAVASISSATINLINNDYDVVISLPENSSVVENVEDAGSFLITATLTAAKSSPVTVDLTFGGDASSSEYVVGGTTSVTVGAGVLSSTATVTIDPVDNMLRDGNRTITVNGRIANSNLNIQEAMNKITIVDNEEAPTVAVKLSPDRVNEDAGTVSVQATATLSDGAPLASAATIKLDFGGTSTATKADDFSKSGTLEITIPTGQTSGSTTLSVTIVDDALHEGEETIVITSTTDASVANNIVPVGGVAPGIADATLTIVDNDYDVKLTVSPDTVTEDAESAVEVTVTATLTGTRTSDVPVGVMYMLGDTQFAGATNVEAANTVMVKAGSMSGTTKVMIDPSSLEDEYYGGNRKINVVGTSEQLNIQDSAITIADDEVKPSVKLTLSATGVDDLKSISETDNDNDNTVTVTVTATLEPNGLAANLTGSDAANIALSLGGTALRVDGMDEDGYDNRDYSAPTITAVNVDNSGTTDFTGSVQIVTNDDDMFESNKTIIISGKNDTFASISSATLELINDDFDVLLTIPEMVGDPVTDNPMIVPEDAEDPVSIAIEASLTAARTSPITVQLAFGGTEASRYVVGGTTTITLGAGVMTGSATVTIDPNDNELRGGNKMIEISGSVPGTELNVQTAEEKITLQDDEPLAVLTLKPDPDSIGEDAGATEVTLAATLNVGLESSTSIELKITDASMATGDGTDYTAGEMAAISIAAGSTSGSTTFTLTPTDDNLHEDPDETIVIEGKGGGLTGTATITLLSNDYDIRLSASPSEVTEGDKATDVVITAELFGGIRSNAVTVNLGVGTASTATSTQFEHNTGTQNANDATMINASSDVGDVNTLSITAGSTMGTATISIDPEDDDNAFSGDKVIVIVGTTADAQNIKAARITLRDLQRAMVTLSADVDTLMEAGALPTDVMVTATLSSPLPSETQVELTKTGSAEKGVDYMVGAPEGGVISIPAGMTEATLPLSSRRLMISRPKVRMDRR